MLKGHGDDGYLHGRPIQADFSTNVYSGGAPEGLKDYLFARWEKVMRYPEVIAESLANKIAAHYQLSNDHILISNGSTESIYLIAQAHRGKRSAIVIPAFSEYEDACRMHGHNLQFIQWEDFPAGAEQADLVFICNPNNPTGAVFTALEQVVRDNPQTLFVVDEAFIEFTLSIKSVLGLCRTCNNLIVMRSMTKVYAIPGLRLGYIVAAPALIDLLSTQKLPWTVNTMALEAGHYIFDHIDHIHLPIADILRDKTQFIQGLSDTTLEIQDSHTHFFIAETQKEGAAALKRFLLENFDILIRDAGNFRGLSQNHIRLATLSSVKNQILIKALSEWKHI